MQYQHLDAAPAFARQNGIEASPASMRTMR